MSRELVNKRRSLTHVLACGVSLIAMTCHIGTATADHDISTTTAGPIATSDFLDDIVIKSGGTITTDDGVVAVTIDTDNSVTIDDNGNIDADDVGAVGILVSSDTTGGITNQGSIMNGAFEVSDDGGEAGGGAIVVNADLDGGISNEYLEDDYAGTITSYGEYGILIHADAGTGDVAVGAVGAGDKAFSIYNQAVIKGSSIVNDAIDGDGITVTAIRVEGDGLGNTATLTSGIHNDGESSSISALAYMADSVNVISIGDEGIVSTLTNSGEILATHIGADADDEVTEANVEVIAVKVEAGGSLASITNELDADADDPLEDSAKIRAVSTMEGVDVIAIQDLSGSLVLIDNEGTIEADSADEDDDTVITKGAEIAIDVSANTAGFTLNNSGEITGDILLGSGDDAINITGGFIDGLIDFGDGANTLGISGGGSFTTATDITTTIGTLDVVVDGGTLVVEEAGFTATNVTITDSNTLDAFDSTVEVQWDPTNPATGALLIADDVTIDNGTIIDVELMAYTATTQIIDVAEANTTLTTSDVDLVVGGIAAGYNTSIDEVGNVLQVTIERKSAADLGLNANQTALYNAAPTALESETTFGAAVGNLQTEAEVVAAYQDMLPDLTGANEDLAMMLQDTSSGMIQDRLKQLRPLFATASTSKSTYRTGYEWGTSQPRQQTGFWGQEGYGAIESTAGAAGDDYEGTLYSFAFGLDSRAKDGSIFGLSFNYGVLDYEPDDAVDDANKASSYLLSAYYSDNMGVLFWDTVATIGVNEYNQTRRVSVADEERLPSATWLGYQAGLQAQVGYVAKMGRTAITPTIGASYTYLGQDSYDEEDGQSMNLAYDSRTFNSMRSNVGMRVEHAFGSGDILFIPSLHAAWSHEFIGDAPEISAAFVSGGNKFTVTGDEVDSDTIYAGAGVTMVFEIGQLDFSYEMQNSDTLTNHALMATLGVAL